MSATEMKASETDIARAVREAATAATIAALQRANGEACRSFAEKLQVTQADIVRAFDRATFAHLTGRLGLRPVRQNGPGGKLYYSTKKVLALAARWHHI